MRTILLLIVLASQCFGYSYFVKLTIDHTKVPNTDRSDFPVLVSESNAAFALVADGGHVTNSAGYDIGFFATASTSGCSSPYFWEMEKYTSTSGSGSVRAHVKVTSVSHTTDTNFYMCFSDGGITSFQSVASSVWDANYKGVYHLPDGTTLTATDSTSGGIGNGTITGATATTGQINGAAALSGTAQYINNGSAATHFSSATFEAWFKTTNLTTAEQIVTKGYQFGAFGLSPNSIEYELAVNHIAAGKLAFQCYDNGVFKGAQSSTSLSSNTWYHAVGTFDGSNYKLYLNGALDTNTANSAHPTTTAVYAIGADLTVDAGNVELFAGVIDEVRISNTARSADWIATEYNNQSSPSTFMTMGTITFIPPVYAPARRQMVVF